jgi:hypothetical protein
MIRGRESGINLARAVVITEAMGATTGEVQHRRGKVQNDAALGARPRVATAHRPPAKVPTVQGAELVGRPYVRKLAFQTQRQMVAATVSILMS